MASYIGKQMFTILILPNNSGSKGNRTMKFGQLIEHNMRNNLFKNHTQNVVEKKLVCALFYKNRN